MKLFVHLVLFVFVSLASVFLNAEELSQLDELTVISTRLNSDIKDLPISVSIITAEEIKKSPAKTIPELLSLEAGVMTRSAFGNYASRSVVDIRGFGATGTQNTLILLDGKKLNDIDQSTINYAAIPIENIERIELIRGSGGVLYGEGAVGGVINIVTKSALPGTKKFNANQFFGSYDSRETNVSGIYSNDLFSLNLFGNLISSNGYRVNNELDQKNIQGDFRVNQDKTEWFAKFGFSEQELGLPGNRTVDPTIGLNELVNDRLGTNNPNDFANEDVQFITIGTKQFIAEGIETIIDLGYRKKEQKAFLENNLSYNETDLEAMFFTPRLSAKFNLLSFNHNVDTGIDIYHYQYHSDISNAITNIGRPVHILDVEQESYALYLNDLINLTNKTSFQIGGRVQFVDLDASDVFDATAPGAAFDAEAPDLEKSDTEYMFNLGLRQILTKSISAFFNFGQNIRFANVDDINQVSFPPPAFATVREFTDLKPQRSRHYDLGVEFKTSKLDASISVYLMKLKNEIHFNPISFLNVNLEPTERKGVEFNINYMPTEKLTASFNYAHTKSTFDEGAFAGNDIPLIPGNTASFIVGYNIFPDINWNTNWNYIGDKFFDNDQTNNFGQKIPSDSTVDSKLIFMKGGFDMSFSANNIFDEKSFDSGVRSTITAGRYNALPLPERNFSFIIGYTFN